MFPSEIKHYYVGRQGTHEKNIVRDDGKISDRYIRHIGISIPKVLDTYIEIIIWNIDNRVDIKAQKRPSDPDLSVLYDYKLTSYKYNNDPFINLFKLTKITKAGQKSLTFEELNQLAEGNAVKYFEQHRISLVKKKNKLNDYEYYAKHQHYSDSEIFEIYKVAVLCPLLKTLPTTKIHPEIVRKNYSNPISFSTIRNYGIAFAFIAIIFTGCYTMWTKTRIGCKCNDGTTSYATGSGACSHHDGVRSWTYEYWWDRK